MIKASEVPELLVAQLTKPVRWAESVGNMQRAGITEFWELGPGKTLSGMINPSNRFPSTPRIGLVVAPPLWSPRPRWP